MVSKREVEVCAVMLVIGCIIGFQLAPANASGVKGTLSMSPWEERGGNVWEAQIPENEGALVRMSIMEVPFLDGTRRPVIFFKVSRQCFDEKGVPAKNMATLTWAQGESSGKLTDCRGVERRQSTPPLIEEAMPPLPFKARCLLQPQHCRRT